MTDTAVGEHDETVEEQVLGKRGPRVRVVQYRLRMVTGTYDERRGKDDTGTKVFSNKENVAHDTSSPSGLGVDVLLVTDRTLPSPADQGNDYSEGRSDEDDEDGANVQRFVVVGNLGRVTIRKLLGSAVSVVMADWWNRRFMSLPTPGVGIQQ